jgi:hypothetical protein
LISTIRPRTARGVFILTGLFTFPYGTGGNCFRINSIVIVGLAIYFIRFKKAAKTTNFLFAH